jgi:hypothetical protein
MPYAPQVRRPPAFYQPPAADAARPPAAYDDVEAETIIADRSEIMGGQRPAQAPEAASEEEKKKWIISGDDVIDKLDNFFGFDRR